jgi:IS5 family transposase
LAGTFGTVLQDRLFPLLREELGPLSPAHERFIRALALLHLDSFVAVRHGRGRPAHDRAAVARAFLAKAVFNLPNTRALLDRLQCDAALRRLCGWETAAAIPDETVFSRAFARFAETQFPQRVHEALVGRTQAERLVGHIVRDSSAIEAREKPQPKLVIPARRPRPSRAKNWRTRAPEKMTRLERQLSGAITLDQMLAELPRACDVGCKTNSKGSKYFWIGYKLHVDMADGQIPISCVLTSASLNDTQVAVPLATLTARRVTSLYDLMDSGYDCDLIREHSRLLNHVPLIPAQRRGPHPALEMAPHEKARLAERTGVERLFSRLKDEFGGQYVRVRGWAKVMAHLMFGILALTADQIVRLLGPPSAASPA